MQSTLNTLKKEHELIDKQVSYLEDLHEDNLRNDKKFFDDCLDFFNTFVLKHHTTESDFLYKWMLEQNKNSDQELIESINKQHTELEDGTKILMSLSSSFEKNPSNELASKIVNEANEFAREYRKHINTEEGFIYLIAEHLSK